MNKYWIQYRYIYGHDDTEYTTVSEFVTTDDLERHWIDNIWSEQSQDELLQVVKL